MGRAPTLAQDSTKANEHASSQDLALSRSMFIIDSFRFYQST